MYDRGDVSSHYGREGVPSGSNAAQLGLVAFNAVVFVWQVETLAAATATVGLPGTILAGGSGLPGNLLAAIVNRSTATEITDIIHKVDVAFQNDGGSHGIDMQLCVCFFGAV